MDIQFYGANCVVLSNKQVRFVFDDNLAQLGAKSVMKAGDVCLFSSPHPDIVPDAKMLIDMAGEYEISGITIRGIQTRAHMDGDSERNAVMYKVTTSDVRILITGHIFPKLSEAKLEEIGTVDVMIVPVGGNGYTLDPVGALQVIKQVEPKVVVPTHFNDANLQYEVPQQELEDAIKIIGFEHKEPVKKLQYKSSDTGDITHIVTIEKS